MSKYSEKKELQARERAEVERLDLKGRDGQDEGVTAAAKPVTDFNRRGKLVDCATILSGARQILKEQAEALWRLKEDAMGIEKGRIVNALGVTELAANKVAWAIEQLEAVK